MSIMGSIAVYVIIWWMIFFMVLPIGSREVLDHKDVKRGQDSGSPKRPLLLIKLLATTLLSLIVFTIFYWLINNGVIMIGPKHDIN